MYLIVQAILIYKTAKSSPKFYIKFHVVRAASLCELLHVQTDSLHNHPGHAAVVVRVLAKVAELHLLGCLKEGMRAAAAILYCLLQTHSLTCADGVSGKGDITSYGHLTSKYHL